MIALARPANFEAVYRHSRGISAISGLILRWHTQGVFVYGHSQITVDSGGKGYLPWLADGPSSSGQGVPIIGPSLPSLLGLKI